MQTGDYLLTGEGVTLSHDLIREVRIGPYHSVRRTVIHPDFKNVRGSMYKAVRKAGLSWRKFRNDPLYVKKEKVFRYYTITVETHRARSWKRDTQGVKYVDWKKEMDQDKTFLDDSYALKVRVDGSKHYFDLNYANQSNSYIRGRSSQKYLLRFRIAADQEDLYHKAYSHIINWVALEGKMEMVKTDSSGIEYYRST